MANVLLSAYACSPPDKAGIGAGEAALGYNLAKELSAHHNVTVITQTDYHAALHDSALKVEYVHVPFFRWLKKTHTTQKLYYYLWQIAAYLRAKKLHKQHPFGVAHHVTYANGWMPSIIGALLPVPFIWGPVGGGQRTPPAFHREYAPAALFEEHTRLLAQKLFRLDPFAWLCRKNASTILVCNKETAHRFFKRQRKRVHFFPVNGLSDQDLRVFSPGKKNKRFTVIMAGRLISLKGLRLGTNAFARFQEKHPTAELLIAGEGPEKNTLRKRITKNKINARILPWQSRNSLAKLMQGSHVFLFPSLRDGGGAAALEAMAAGLPVICFNHAGPAVLVNHTTGIKIPVTNPTQAVNDFANALTTLAADPQKLDNLSANARQHAETFHWKKLARHILTLYSQTPRQDP